MFKKLTKFALAGLAMTIGAALDARVNQAQASEPFIAEIRIFAGNFSPRGWAFCNGQLLPISQNTALFALVGTAYGGDGRTTFALPDLRGRVAIHPGTGPGLSPVRLGERGGTETNTLSVANLPSHNHTINASSANADAKTPAGNVWAVAKQKSYSMAAPDVQMAASASGSTGGGVAINNRQPYLGINHIIALVGLFPSRN